MNVAIKFAGILFVVAICASSLTLAMTDEVEDSSQCDDKDSAWCIAPRVDKTLEPLANATQPKLATPQWMQPKTEPEARTVTYDVRTRGTISADIGEFSQLAAQTLNDSRGWAKLGVSFKEVDGNSDFTLWLSEASSMTTFSATGCDTTYSCSVGRDNIINQDRWLKSTPSWIGADGDLRSYRQMVVNHEVGHWLGHGHRTCDLPGSDAAVMQQQSISMQGCKPNAWPLSSELYAPKLGIRS